VLTGAALRLHFHDLRHTGNTLAARTGTSLRDLMARMGHDSPQAALLPARDGPGGSGDRRRAQRPGRGGASEGPEDDPADGAQGTDRWKRRRQAAVRLMAR